MTVGIVSARELQAFMEHENAGWIVLLASLQTGRVDGSVDVTTWEKFLPVYSDWLAFFERYYPQGVPPPEVCESVIVAGLAAGAQTWLCFRDLDTWRAAALFESVLGIWRDVYRVDAGKDPPPYERIGDRQPTKLEVDVEAAVDKLDLTTLPRAIADELKSQAKATRRTLDLASGAVIIGGVIYLLSLKKTA